MHACTPRHQRRPRRAARAAPPLGGGALYNGEASSTFERRQRTAKVRRARVGSDARDTSRCRRPQGRPAAAPPAGRASGRRKGPPLRPARRPAAGRAAPQRSRPPAAGGCSLLVLAGARSAGRGAPGQVVVRHYVALGPNHLHKTRRRRHHQASTISPGRRNANAHANNSPSHGTAAAPSHTSEQERSAPASKKPRRPHLHQLLPAAGPPGAARPRRQRAQRHGVRPAAAPAAARRAGAARRGPQQLADCHLAHGLRLGRHLGRVHPTAAGRPAGLRPARSHRRRRRARAANAHLHSCTPPQAGLLLRGRRKCAKVCESETSET